MSSAFATFKTSTLGWLKEQDRKALAAVGVSVSLVLIGGICYYKFFKVDAAAPTVGSSQGDSSGGSSAAAEEGQVSDPVLRLKNEGNQMFQKKQFTEAIDKYSAALNLLGDSDAKTQSILYQNRAAANDGMNKWTEVIADCTKAIMLDKFYAKAYGRRCKAYARMNKHDEAFKDGLFCMALHEKDKKRPPTDVQGCVESSGVSAARLAGNHYLENRTPVIPTQYEFKMIFKTYPHDPMVSSLGQHAAVSPENRSPFQKACALWMQGDYTQLVALCTEEIENTDSQLKCLALLMRGCYYFLAGDRNKAKADFTLINRTPDATNEEKCAATLRVSACHLQEFNEAELQQSFALAKTFWPTNPDIYNQQAQFYMMAEELAKADESSREAISVAADDLQSRIMSVGLEFNQSLRNGDMTKVLNCIEKFKHLSGEHAEESQIWSLLIKGYRMIGQVENALKTINEALANVESAYQAPLYLEMGEIHAGLKQQSACMESYKKALALDPRNQEVNASYANICLAFNLYDTAIETFDKMIPIIKSDMEMYQLCHLKNSAQAQSLIKKLLGIDSTNYVARVMQQANGQVM